MFDEATKQVKFLYSNLDLSPYNYFKEVRDGQLVDKPLLRAVVDVKAGNQIKTPNDVATPSDQDKDQVDDSPLAT